MHLAMTARPRNTPIYQWLYDIFASISDNRAAIEYRTNGTLPDNFLVYYIVSETPQAHFSNRLTRTNTRVSLCYLTRSKAELEAKGAAIQAIAAENGLLYIGTSADNYHDATDHWARTIDFRIIEEVS